MTEGEKMVESWHYVRKQLGLRKGQWNQISRDTGLSFNWVRKAGRGELRSPGVHNLAIMVDYLREKEERNPAKSVKVWGSSSD